MARDSAGDIYCCFLLETYGWLHFALLTVLEQTAPFSTLPHVCNRVSIVFVYVELNWFPLMVSAVGLFTSN